MNAGTPGGMHNSRCVSNPATPKLLILGDKSNDVK